MEMGVAEKVEMMVLGEWNEFSLCPLVQSSQAWPKYYTILLTSNVVMLWMTKGLNMFASQLDE
jgi:hypothetical protein